tara:strand:+ start:1070 stop:2050 length:981 start_codon:yes stop_codon:yes gene_type:complete
VSYLLNHQVFASQDLHQARDVLSHLNSIDALDVIGTNRDVDVAIHFAELADIGLIYASFGTGRIHIKTPSIDEEDLFFMFVTSGSAQVRHGKHECNISPDLGLIRNMRVPLSATEDNFSTLGTQLSLSVLRAHAQALTGQDIIHNDLVFGPELDLKRPETQHVRNTLQYVANALDGPLTQFDNPQVRSELRDMLLTNILMLLPNSYSDVLNGKPAGVAMPHYVKRARDYIHAHAAQSIGLQELVEYSGCSYRTLQSAFGETFGMSPMVYVRMVRLNGAHNDLLVAEDGDTVATIARKWGFGHVGRFSGMYARQFGVVPSETLRRRL